MGPGSTRYEIGIFAGSQVKGLPSTPKEGRVPTAGPPTTFGPPATAQRAPKHQLIIKVKARSRIRITGSPQRFGLPLSGRSAQLDQRGAAALLPGCEARDAGRAPAPAGP